MSGITSADRQMAWNIRILQCPPKISCVGGAYQLWQQPFLCWQEFFNDLIFCFDLNAYLQSTNSVLALWVRNLDEVVVHGLTNPYVSYSTKPNTNESTILSHFISVGNVISEPNEDPQLHLSLVLHDIRNCVCSQSSLDNHLQAGKHEL